MKPPPFEYYSPETLAETLTLLDECGSEAKILAGGQSLMPLMSLRLVRPGALIDINRVCDLAYIHRGASGGLAIGGLTRQRTVETSGLVHEQNPLLAATIPLIGHFPIRNRGTLGGSLVHADPAAELPAIAVILDVELVLSSLRRQRVVQAKDFFLSYMTTAIEPVELLTEIRFPPWPSRCGWAIREISRRAGDFAVTGVATLLGLNGDDVCEDARIGLFGVSATPVRVEAAEAILKGRHLDNRILAEAAGVVSEVLEPDSDVHASSAYRKEVSGVLTRRSLEGVLQRMNERKDG